MSEHVGIKSLSLALAQANEELRACREALQRTRSALAAIADGIVVTDMQGRITSLNPVASHLTGWPELESLARPLADVVRIVDPHGDMVDLLATGFRNGGDDIGSLVRRDGHVILIDGSVAQVHDDARNAVGYIITFRNVTAATRMIRELSYHANHDALTGLLNRRVLEARLERAVASAADLGCRHALLYFDLDRFKSVNDSGGHVAGDELLRQLAVILRRQLREHDTLARVGGDEFAVLLENCTAPRANAVAEKIRATLGAFAFTWEGRSYRPGASVGQVEFSGAGLAIQDIIEAADRMCYAAKASGRDRIAACTLDGIDPATGVHAARQHPDVVARS
jgi:diguanylate cyclase (GGDEF)-like protein/PAS domain S-box-containing protein